MRALLWFIGTIALSLLIATALAYPAYELIHPLQSVWRIDKIASRLFDLVLLVTLIVVLGLSLWSAEGKVERDQLVAVGASPRVLARVAGVRACLLAFTGGVIAVPVGLVTLWVVFSAKHVHTPFPWLTAAMVAVVLPLIVAGTDFHSRLERRPSSVV